MPVVSSAGRMRTRTPDARRTGSQAASRRENGSEDTGNLRRSIDRRTTKETTTTHADGDAQNHSTKNACSDAKRNCGLRPDGPHPNRKPSLRV